MIKFLQINVLLNIIDFDLINKFSLLTSFHGYDESLQDEEKNSIVTIEKVINECNELLFEKIIKPNQSSMNFNEEINQNCFELKNILIEEMNILCQNLNKLIKYRKEKNNHENEYQHIIDGVTEIISSLQDKFIFLNNNEEKNEEQICEENKENIVNLNNEDNKDAINSNISDEIKLQKRLSTTKETFEKTAFMGRKKEGKTEKHREGSTGSNQSRRS